MLYRYGNREFWDHVVSLFHEKLREDRILRSYFERRRPAEVQMINFAILKAGLGYADAEYEELIKYAHIGKSISTEDMHRFLNCLRLVLDDVGVAPEDIEIIVGRIEGYSNLIVEEDEV
ncbi:unnamed protein product [Blepharisma stoltei]|uniref:Uncharacterized protein n=1 Tax=Blepharisma stoltei TaxID=1481888 RepID=A0AAU9IVF6_9CILI|nr:unnamed protein product [Blepharisma stoltei]